MADDDDNESARNGNIGDDIRAEIAAGLMECRIAVESVAMAARTLALREAARPILPEFQVLIRLLEQAVEAFEAIADKIDAVFGFRNRADA